MSKRSHVFASCVVAVAVATTISATNLAAQKPATSAGGAPKKAATGAPTKPMTTASGEWPSYSGDTRGTRYAPLDQINADNFSKLEVAWRFKTDSMGPRPEFKLEGTPLMAGGVLYATGGSTRAVIAVNAATGEKLWVHREDEGARGEAAARPLSGRGLSYWTDGKAERILYVTPGYKLIALDAKTGARIPTFGTDGEVDLKLNNDQTVFPDLITGEIGFQGAPVVGRDVVVIGAAFKEGGAPKSFKNNKGY
ncbi:MAG: PQQ-binding-like beta-propeller repeat protein, partial [Gemmatimonadaceae bacterium]